MLHQIVDLRRPNITGGVRTGRQRLEVRFAAVDFGASLSRRSSVKRLLLVSTTK